MVKQLYINGTGSGTYGVYLNSDTYLDSPSMDYKEYSVPARNGNVINYNKRMNNIIRKFDCYINSNVLSNLNSFKKLIYGNTGYMKIESDYDSDTYQLGYLAQEINVEPFNETGNFSVKFTLYFSCLPQKWFKNNSTSSWEQQGSMSGIFVIYHRSNPEVQRIIKQLPISEQPTADYYALMDLGQEQNMGTITNVSATNSNGLVIVYYANSYLSDYTTDVICYGNGTATASSYTPATQTGGQYIRSMFPVSGVALTASLTATTSNGTKTKSEDTTNFTSNISNTDAFGVTMDYELVTRMHNSQVLSAPIIYNSSYNGTQQNEMMAIIHFEQMDAALIQKIRDDFSTGSPNYYVTIEIDSNNTANIVKGTDTMNITSYLEVNGEIDGKADKVTFTDYRFAGNPGIIQKVTLKPRWWKL